MKDTAKDAIVTILYTIAVFFPNSCNSKEKMKSDEYTSTNKKKKKMELSITIQYDCLLHEGIQPIFYGEA